MKKLMMALAATTLLAACNNNPAEKTLFQASSALQNRDLVALEDTLVNQIAVRQYYTSEELVEFYSELFSGYKHIEIENIRQDKAKQDSSDKVYIVADITGRALIERINYRNGTSEDPNDDIRIARKLGDRETIRFVKMSCDSSSNKFGYENCKISTFARASQTENNAGESFSDGPSN